MCMVTLSLTTPFLFLCCWATTLAWNGMYTELGVWSQGTFDF